MTCIAYIHVQHVQDQQQQHGAQLFAATTSVPACSHEVPQSSPTIIDSHVRDWVGVAVGAADTTDAAGRVSGGYIRFLGPQAQPPTHDAHMSLGSF